MSVLLGSAIIEEVKKGKIIIEPFHEENVGPNSVDVTLSNKLLTYIKCSIRKDRNGNNIVYPVGDSTIVDMAIENEVYELEIPEAGLVLMPNILYLGSTNEKAGSDFFVPMYEGRSSMARLGIQSHLSAGFGDIFFKSNWTLEITVVHPTKVYANSRFGQVYFHEVSEDARETLVKSGKYYNGKYTNQPGPQKSKSYLDFPLKTEEK
ncbi:MAG: dCTP deaminase [Candidatus Cloacimonadota bacterium]|nr:MAG: dCTP deaminase [Candidatus Cloacimonadota bacterium]